MANLYEMLGVDSAATSAAIDAAYLRLKREANNVGNDSANYDLAYSVLANKRKRQAYDIALSKQTPLQESKSLPTLEEFLRSDAARQAKSTPGITHMRFILGAFFLVLVGIISYADRQNKDDPSAPAPAPAPVSVRYTSSDPPKAPEVTPAQPKKNSYTIIGDGPAIQDIPYRFFNVTMESGSILPITIRDLDTLKRMYPSKTGDNPWIYTRIFGCNFNATLYPAITCVAQDMTRFTIIVAVVAPADTINYLFSIQLNGPPVFVKAKVVGIYRNNFLIISVN